MKRFAAPLLTVAVILIGFTITPVGQQAQPAGGGVFTAAQAQAGQAAYAQQCAGCHGQDFRGSADAPSLQGEDFRTKWGPRAVNDLFTTLVQTMPPTNPGVLGEEGTLGVTAFLLQINGARAVVIGRSRIVGLPIALLLLHRHATVTICHSRTGDLAAVAREADILIAAIGRTGMVDSGYIKPGAAVVDVGMNRVTTREDLERFFGDDPKRRAAFDKNGYTLIGDVNPREAAEVAGYLTPVPGGVGPLTIAMLMKNTLNAMKARRVA